MRPFYGCRACSSECAWIVPSSRWVYKSLPRTSSPSLLQHTRLPPFYKTRETSENDLSLLLPKIHHNTLMGWLLSLPKNKQLRAMSASAVQNYISLSQWPSLLGSKQQSGFVMLDSRAAETSEKSEEKNNGDTFMHLGAGLSFTPLPLLLAACQCV